MMGHCRKTLYFISLLAYVIFYILRVNLSVAIVGMVVEAKRNDILITSSCPVPVYSTQKPNQSKALQGEFLWNEELQGKVLGSFFIGYFCTNFIGGRLSESVGAKFVAGNGIFLTALLALLLPYAAFYSVYLLIFLRFLQGLTEGVVFPAFNVLSSNWIPQREKGLFLTMLSAGCHLGTLIAMGFSGFVIESGGGWPWVFYYSGFIGVIWSVSWYFLVFDSPSHHPWIDKHEKNIILNSLVKPSIIPSDKIPFYKIFTSRPFQAVILAHFSANIGWYLLLTMLPTYFSTVHHLDIKQNGVLSAFPYVGSLMAGLIYAVWSYRVTGASSAAIKSLRQRTTILTHFLPAMCFLLISYAGCHLWVATFLISAALMGLSVSPCGFLCGYQDLSPNLAGTLSGIGNTFATIPGFIAPAIAGIILNDEPSLENWQTVFELTAGFYLIAGIVYFKFVSVEVEPWNTNGNSEGTKKLIQDI